MSRVAKNPVSIPSGVEIMLDEKSISVSGSKGKSEFTFPESVSATHADDLITVSYDESSSESTALAGTTRSLINNMVIGVSEGFQKTLILVELTEPKQVERNWNLIGFFHPVHYELLSRLKLKHRRKLKLCLKVAISKFWVVVCEIRAFRPPSHIRVRVLNTVMKH